MNDNIEYEDEIITNDEPNDYENKNLVWWN